MIAGDEGHFFACATVPTWLTNTPFVPGYNRIWNLEERKPGTKEKKNTQGTWRNMAEQ